MPAALADLPDDVETLKRLLIERDQVIAAKDATIATSNQERLLLVTTIEMLKLQIARLKRMQFGRSSEKTEQEIAQLELIVEDLETTSAQLEQRTDLPAAPRTQPVRRPLPEHLPREVIRHEPGDACGRCGGTLRMIGEDSRNSESCVAGTRSLSLSLPRPLPYERSTTLPSGQNQRCSVTPNPFPRGQSGGGRSRTTGGALDAYV